MTWPWRLVVGCDFSAEGDVALGQAIATARLTGAELVLAHVMRSERRASEPHGEGSRSKREAWGSPNGLRTRLEHAREELRDAKVAPSDVVAEGEADETLTDLQRSTEAELLVLGSHGRSGVRWLLMGSVAERAARVAHPAVLIARREVVGRRGFRRILVPTDYSELSLAALEGALALAAPGARVDVLHCWQSVGPGPGEARGGDRLEEGAGGAVLDEADRRGRALVARYRGDRSALELALAKTPPRQGIHSALETGQYDLVALGGRGHREPKRWLLGRVADAIARHAPCSVLLVNAPVRAAIARRAA